MAWLHYQLNGHEYEQARGVGDGQGSLVCCSPWGCKGSDTTEWLNNKNNKDMATGFPVLHYLVELAQTHVHWVGDVTQPFHPRLPPSPPAFNLSQHQGLFQPVGKSSQIITASASVLPMNIQDCFPLGWTGWISLPSKGLSGVFSNTTVWKHSFFRAQPSLSHNSHIHTWWLEKKKP